MPPKMHNVIIIVNGFFMFALMLGFAKWQGLYQVNGFHCV